jgi:MoaA/NifB/PqqE/SkfB family radical SAM enzyme
MPQRDLDPEIFEHALQSFPDLEHIELQGEGEPLMHPHFFDMVRSARRRGIRVSIITNGSFFSPARVEALLDADLEKVMVSLESPDADTFRAIRGGHLDKVLRGVELLVRRRNERRLDKPAVGFAMTVLRSTRDQIPVIVDLYERLGLDGGISRQTLNRMDQYARNYDAQMRAEMLSQAEEDELWRQLGADDQIQHLLSGGDAPRGFYDQLYAGFTPGARTCPWLERGVFVMWDGGVTACCLLKDADHLGYGRIGQDDPALMLARRDVARQTLREGRIPEMCSGCWLAQAAIGPPPPTSQSVAQLPPETLASQRVEAPPGDRRAELNVALRAAAEENARLKGAVDAVRTEVRALRASRSWRATRPLRLAYEMLLTLRRG